jgi:hypothetical protein
LASPASWRFEIPATPRQFGSYTVTSRRARSGAVDADTSAAYDIAVANNDFGGCDADFARRAKPAYRRFESVSCVDPALGKMRGQSGCWRVTSRDPST